jgi:hypothetical protein
VAQNPLPRALVLHWSLAKHRVPFRFGTWRKTSDSHPNTRVWVHDGNDYEGEPGGWFTLGGASVASASLAGVVNSAGHFASSNAAELTTIYGHLGVWTDFHDAVAGICGPYAGWIARMGWDFCTGIDSPSATVGSNFPAESGGNQTPTALAGNFS